MKLYLAGILLSFSLISSSFAQNSAELTKIWDNSFTTYQQAEEQLSSGNNAQALKSFENALKQFRNVKRKKLNDWQAKIISYRIGLCRSNIESIKKSRQNNPVSKTTNTVNKPKPVSPPRSKVAKQGQAPVVVNRSSEMNELKKQRKSIEETLKIYIDKYNKEASKTESLKLDLRSVNKKSERLKALNDALVKKLEMGNQKKQAQVLKNSNRVKKVSKEYELRIAKLQGAIKKSNAEKSELKIYIDSKELEFDKITVSNDLLNVKVLGLQNEVKTKDSVITELKSQNQAIETNLRAAKETSAKTNDYVSSQKQYITKLTDEMNSLKEKLTDKTALLKSSEEQLETANKENYQLKMFLQEKINEKNTLSTQFAELKTLNKKTTKDLTATRSELRSLASQMQQTNDQLNTKNKEILLQNETIASKTTSINELQDRYKTLQQESTTAKAKLSELRSTLQSHKNYVTELKARINALEQSVASKSKTIQSRDEQLTTGQESISMIKEALRLETEEKEALKNEIVKTKSNGFLKDGKINNFENELTKLKKENSDLKEEIIKKDENTVQNAADKSKLKLGMAELEMALKTKDIEISVLNGQIRSSRLNKDKAQQAPTFTGTLYRIKSKSKYVTHALVDSEKKPLCYVHFTSPAEQYEKKNITISGAVKNVKGWKVPILTAAVIEVN